MAPGLELLRRAEPRPGDWRRERLVPCATKGPAAFSFSSPFPSKPQLCQTAWAQCKERDGSALLQARGGGGGRGGELQALVYEDAFLTDKALQGRLRASEGPPDPSSKQQGQQRLAKFASCSCGRKRGSAVCASLPYLGIILSRVLRHFPPQEQAAGGVFHSHKSQPRGLGFGVGFLFQVSPKLAHATEREGGAID